MGVIGTEREFVRWEGKDSMRVPRLIRVFAYSRSWWMTSVSGGSNV